MKVNEGVRITASFMIAFAIVLLSLMGLGELMLWMRGWLR